MQKIFQHTFLFTEILLPIQKIFKTKMIIFIDVEILTHAIISIFKICPLLFILTSVCLHFTVYVPIMKNPEIFSELALKL
mgnify:CR=1 FL=1